MQHCFSFSKIIIKGRLITIERKMRIALLHEKIHIVRRLIDSDYDFNVVWEGCGKPKSCKTLLTVALGFKEVNSFNENN